MNDNQKSIAVLGATGSIGSCTLDLIARFPERYRATLLTASTNASSLVSLALKHRPDHVVLVNPQGRCEDLTALEDMGIGVHFGEEALLNLLGGVDITINGITGIAGLMPTMKVIEQGGTIAVANKESLVAAGALVMEAAQRHQAVLLPTDSEHNAIFQLWADKHEASVSSVTLTASGGAFLARTVEEMADVTPEDALRHPNWSMGRKITIDSATMMNKGLEIIEACVLFGLPEQKVKVVVHPQSVIHGMVSYADGSVVAQLAKPDMRVPISLALAWPDRLDWADDVLDLTEISALQFYVPDEKKYPALGLAREAQRAGGLAPCILNAANEVAVSEFLEGRLAFLDIVAVCMHILNEIENHPSPTLDDIIETDRMVSRATLKRIKKDHA